MRNPIYNVFLISLLFVLFALSFRDWNDINTVKYCIFIMLIDIAVFFIYQQYSTLKGFWYKPSNFFLLSFIIVNFQRAVDLCLGYKTYDMLVCYVNFNNSIILSTFSLIIFTISYINTEKKIIRNIKNKYRKKIQIKSYSVNLLVIFQIIFFILWISSANIFMLISGKDYGSNNVNTNSFESLHYFSIVAILITVIHNTKEKLTLKQFLKIIPTISWIFLVLYLVIRFVSGDRGPFMYTSLAIFFSFVYVSKYKIPTTFIVSAIIGIAFILNIVGMARSYDTNKDFGERFYQGYVALITSDDARFSEKSISPLTDELAGSYKCNTIAIDIIENKYDTYHKGLYSLYGLMHCVPFSPSLLSNVFEIPGHEQLSDLLFTEYYLGRSDQYQIGTNLIADSYIDFGVIGVVFMFLLIGWIFKKIDLIICLKYRTHFILLLICIMISSCSIYMPRSTLFAQLKNFIPIFTMLYINKLFNKLYEK